MSKLLFYCKLASTNLRKNKEAYLPYLLTSIGCAAMLYIMLFLNSNEGLSKMRRARDVIMLMGFGTAVVVIFSAILLFYTNRFLIKRRKREFGLYSILGMEKKHIGLVMLCETLYSYVIVALGGIFVGALLSRLAMMSLLKLAGLGKNFSEGISVSSVIITLGALAVIMLTALGFNLLIVGKTKAIELLHSESQGEREPKSRWLLALLGLATLGGGYYLALSVDSPIDAIGAFFIAVLLVIAGTYLLFTAGSIAFLKLLRKNKRYYYKTGHFVSVSSMLHRMKANAVGLSNICILSTMVLVTISTTVTLNIGMTKTIDVRYPHDLTFRISGEPNDEGKKLILDAVEKGIAESGCEITWQTSFSYLAFTAVRTNDGFGVEIPGAGSVGASDTRVLVFVTLDDYNKTTGRNTTLARDEVLYGNLVGDFEKDSGNSFELFGKSYKAVKAVAEMPLPALYRVYTNPVYAIVVSDRSVLDEIYAAQTAAYTTDEGDWSSKLDFYMSFDLEGDDDMQEAAYDNMKMRINDLFDSYEGGAYELLYPKHELDDEDCGYSYASDCRVTEAASIRSMFGGFLFLGIMLGLMFLMASIMIIYYKQIAEGYEDKKRYTIMKKVGITPSEIRGAVFAQTIIFFFLPLGVATLHVAVAFPIINKLICLFGLENMLLFLICTLATILAFALLYVVVYILTARKYYKIVNK